MFTRLAAAGLAAVLIITTTGRIRADDGQKKADARDGQQTSSPAAQTSSENSNHEPGKAVGVPPRDPKADKSCIGLTNYYTLGLTEDASGVYGYTLAILPRGVQKLGNVTYDLRGVVQTSSQVFANRHQVFPEAVKGIKVGLKCSSLCFLHASRWTEREGAQIGTYVIHYADGQRREVPIIFGVDLRDWRPGWDPGARNAPGAANGPVVAWRGHDADDVELFQSRWANPLPDVEIASIDMVSAMTDAAPFLVAVTAE